MSETNGLRKIQHSLNDFSSTAEFQLRKMFASRVGRYGETFIGDGILDTDTFDWGVGFALSFQKTIK